jgi:hypothetical protein
MRIPRVSVIMSVYNGERFVNAALESILNQSFRDFEFLIIDDGSSDHTPSILDSYEKMDSRIKVHHQNNRGVAAALNRGYSLARGEYIARMDSDDIAIEGRLGRQVDFLDSHKEVAVLGGAVEFVDSAGRSLGLHRYPGDNSKIRSAQGHSCGLWHPTVMMRRKVLEWAGGYREVVVDAEDYDLWLRVGESFQMANLDAVVLKYRIHPRQVSLLRWKNQAISVLAARSAAAYRKTGRPDPLNSLSKITPEAVRAMGVSSAEQDEELVSYGKIWIRHMRMAGEEAAALTAALELLQCPLKHVPPSETADLHYTVAQLYWRQKQPFKSLGACLRAAMTKPRIIGRLVKHLVRKVSAGANNGGALRQME